MFPELVLAMTITNSPITKKQFDITSIVTQSYQTSRDLLSIDFSNSTEILKPFTNFRITEITHEIIGELYDLNNTEKEMYTMIIKSKSEIISKVI